MPWDTRYTGCRDWQKNHKIHWKHNINTPKTIVFMRCNPNLQNPFDCEEQTQIQAFIQRSPFSALWNIMVASMLVNFLIQNVSIFNTLWISIQNTTSKSIKTNRYKSEWWICLKSPSLNLYVKWQAELAEVRNLQLGVLWNV